MKIVLLRDIDRLACRLKLLIVIEERGLWVEVLVRLKDGVELRAKGAIGGAEGLLMLI